MKKVRCIDGIDKCLTTGKIYDVTSISMDERFIRVTDDLGRPNSGYLAERFEEVQELPESWKVKVNATSVRLGLQNPVIIYLNSTYNRNFDGTAEYYGVHEGQPAFWKGEVEKCTEITLQQFKELVLKEQSMNKKITGYKLLKPYPGLEVGKVYDKHEHQGNTEWFEPQFEEEIQIFKKGDVVTCLNTPSREGKQGTYDNGGKGAGWEENLTFIVTGIDETSKGYSIIWGPDNGGVYDNYLRSATEEEKKDIFTVQIAEYPSKYTKKGVHFGCNFYSKEDVKSLLDIMERENSSIRAVLVAGNNKVTRSQLTIILSGIENSQND